MANRSEFAVVPVQGFNPQKVKDFSGGMETTLGAKLLKVAIFDRDYRSDAEVLKITTELDKFCWLSVVLGCKELENFLLFPAPIERAVKKRLAERERAGHTVIPFMENMADTLMQLADEFKNQVQARLVSARQQFERNAHTTLDQVTISEAAMNDFDHRWKTFEGRMKMVPGKELFSSVNAHLQNTYKIALSPLNVVDCFSRDEINPELVKILFKLDELRKQEVPEQPSLDLTPSAPVE